jgi:hypothetical protein
MLGESSGVLAERKVRAFGARSRARIRLIVRFLLGLLVAQTLAGCGGGGYEAALPTSAGSSPPPPTSGSSLAASEAWNGRFVGTVKIGDRVLYGDALLTVDGAVRLYLGGPYASDGTVQETRPESSAQFVGKIGMHSDAQAVGTGVIIGQGCAAADHGRFCGQTATGNISVSVVSGDIQGEIQVTTNAGYETWLLELGPWSNYYVLSARPADLAGQYTEELAEFAPDGDVIVNVDGAGHLFFQSAHSGCTGNGTLTPHLNGQFNVYDVALTIESCNAPYAYLNGAFEGLATTTPDTYWDYDSLLRIWLSTRDGSPSQAAVTMLGSPL